MSEIHHSDLTGYLKTLDGERPAPVYLLYGEEMLYKDAFHLLLDRIIPESQRSFNYDPLDGATEDMADVIAGLNTYALMPGRKVVALMESRLFYSDQDEQSLIERAMAAWEKNHLKKAAQYVIALLERLNIAVEEVRTASDRERLKDSDLFQAGGEWLDAVLDFIAHKGQRLAKAEDSAALLQNAIEKGFPHGHHLIITSEWVDKRRRLFKAIKQQGVIVDCSVPRGDRKADRMAQQSVMSDTMRSVLSESGKAMDKPAFERMTAMTGFDLATFSNNLRKLVDYVGSRETITQQDVEFVLKRTKKDPIYELTNAMAERRCLDAIFFLESLLAADIHFLQALAAMTNQIRRLLLARDFIDSPAGRDWQAGCPYARFQRQVLPAVQAGDLKLSEIVTAWEDGAAGPPVAGSKKAPGKAKKGRAELAADLKIARTPHNPYPIYQLFKNADNFSRDDLISAMAYLQQADLQLKSSALNPKLILEEAILHICRRRKGGPQAAGRGA